MRPKILIVDDEEPFREDLAKLAVLRGFDCSTAGDIKTGAEIAHSIGPCAVLCDVIMPGGGAIAFLRSVSGQEEIGVFVMTAFGSLETAMDAFRAGAVDYLLKPLNIDEVLRKVRGFLEHRDSIREVRALRHELSRLDEPDHVVGSGAAAAALQDFIQQVAPVRTTVLITGETGTGKEVVARSIHASGPWRSEPFLAVNCAALPETLLESELFGHEKGAFTGAVGKKMGLFEAAGDGTLFLDEVGTLTLGSQAKLLRAVEGKQVTRVGSTRPQVVSARIIAATARDLQKAAKEGEFRDDLYFRLAVMEIHLPALRERRGDIPLFVEHFVRKFSAELGKRVKGVDPPTMQRLLTYSWPGNLRELQNIIERGVILARGEQIGLAQLPVSVSGDAPDVECPDDLRSARKAFEREHIRQVLAASGGNVHEAARRLGVDPATLYRKHAEPGDPGG
ncbi:MAG: sigma-54-dependent Fis family transcriptional regulator [Planctomycetes bacterium]|nr:sigma-54-dependent Fis family transcriptional regulator [Planctomycetota bacterium]